MAKAIGKITAKVVIGEELKEAFKLKQEDKTFERFEAIRIQGRVDKVKTAPSALNPENTDVKLTGEFIATNCKTGEQFQSATFYPIGGAMCDLMAQAEPGSMFAVRVFLAPSKKTVQGYTFEFESALEVKPSDAVSRLSEAFAALPAPGQTTADKAAKSEKAKK